MYHLSVHKVQVCIILASHRVPALEYVMQPINPMDATPLIHNAVHHPATAILNVPENK
jgi:hypothetical protein